MPTPPSLERDQRLESPARGRLTLLNACPWCGRSDTRYLGRVDRGRKLIYVCVPCNARFKVGLTPTAKPLMDGS
jgi:hypothetical protein